MSSENLYLQPSESSYDVTVSKQEPVAMQEAPTNARQRNLFVKISSFDVAFLFAHKMRKNKYLVKIDKDSKEAFREYGVAPYDIIEINESVSADAMIDFIVENHENSLITILLPS
jgi:hypothetical protein